MLTHAVDFRLPMTRRGFLRAAGLAFAAGFTAIADELARLFRICSLDAARGSALSTPFAGYACQEA